MEDITPGEKQQKRGRAKAVVFGTSLNEKVSACVRAFQGYLFAWREINVRYC